MESSITMHPKKTRTLLFFPFKWKLTKSNDSQIILTPEGEKVSLYESQICCICYIHLDFNSSSFLKKSGKLRCYSSHSTVRWIFIYNGFSQTQAINTNISRKLFLTSKAWNFNRLIISRKKNTHYWKLMLLRKSIMLHLKE